MFERIVTTLLTLAALGIAATFAHREFAGPQYYGTSENPVPIAVEGWEDAVEIGRTTGAGRVQVVEFADLECPICAKAYARWHSDTSSVGRRFRSKVSYTFVHFPLKMHRFARPAARAAECARNSGRFFEFVSAVFAKQDSLGLRPWNAYARDAGVKDLVAFDRCAVSTIPIIEIDKGVALGERLGVTGTPAIVINGWKYQGLIADSTYANAIDAALAGRKPPHAR